ncbi:metal ABC transporter substrate-binding protein [Thermotalea metallivorans]|uniref:High-affinity zinc uptake system binding-protein ZnuA n=1 Tax=Thermotalea metallivorans TaxID=520762 RepID=A0A140L6F9_9FIRM|nr:metal ABC transporter substrate-binding protein [Thermotalea metallivorans]KXG76134.1 High-affinity zinc uptake system binding-protein ZnuA [Thermotalea metallivorans]
MRNKKFQGLSLLVVFFIVFMAGCSKPTQRPEEEALKDRIVVYASFYPMYDFAKNIGKDKIDLKLMIPPGVEVHDWEPTAKLMGNMEKADVFIYNGLGMEPWAEKLIASVQNDQWIVIEASQGVALLEAEEHEEEEHGDEEEGSHGDYDPHVWLNPMNALKQAENIKNAFVKADEANRDFYERNFKEFADKLKALDQKFQEELRDVKKKEMVVAHGAFGYLAHRYGLEQVAITGLSPQEEPSAAKLAEITKFAKERNLKYIFFETLTSPRLAEVLAQEVGAKTAVLNPIEGLTQEEMKAGKDYISVMEENLKTLKQALMQ